MSYLQEAAIEPQQAFSTNTSPNELSNQQSRRGSLLETQQTRIPNNIVAGGSSNEFQSNLKYMQDSFETEKHKSNRTSPTNRSGIPDRKGSLRFYDEIPSSNFADKERDETSSAVQQNASIYENKELKYNQSPQEYNQTNQTKPEPPFYDTQLDYRGQSHNVYEPEQYDDPRYNDQQNYDGIQYRAEVQQPTSEYEYQPGYQEYDTQQQVFQSNNLPLETLQPEQQYDTDIYQERATNPSHDARTVQQYQNLTESNSGTSNMGQRKGNGHVTNNQPNMSKQFAPKKFT